MVRGFVEQSDGVIEIESKVGRGTIVELFLPLSEQRPSEPAEDAKGPRQNAGHARQRTVLVVEDNPQLLAIISLKLEHDGYEVIQKESGDEAIEYLDRDVSVDLVVSDLIMPGLAQGMDVLERTKRHDPPVPTILISGYADVTSDGAFALDRADRFLEKPLNLQQLSEEIAGLV